MDKILPAARGFVLETLFMRCISFGLNQLLVRFVSPVTIGLAAIQLELLLSSLLFLSREAIRLALLRASTTDKIKLRQFINISWLPASMQLIILIACSVSQRSWSVDVPPSVILLYVLGAFLEACAEPFFNYYNNRIVLRPRVLAESIAVVTRSLSNCIFVVYFRLDVIGFGIAQVCYGFVYLLILASCCSWSTDHSNAPMSLGDFLPRPLQLPKTQKTSFQDMLAYQVGIENLQNVFATGPFFIFKHLLTECDKIVLTSIRSPYDQGVYAILNNYVSLIARLVFYPIEESSRLAFAQMTLKIRHDKSDAEAHAVLVQQSRLLFRLVLALSLFGVIFPLFGSHYARLFVHIFLGPQWHSEETVKTLVAFCPYVFALGINGVTEAYVHTIVPSTAFSNVNMNLLHSSVMFAIVAFPLITYMGTSGVVVANCISMIVRTVLNYQLIVDSFGYPTEVFERPMQGLEGMHFVQIMPGFLLPRVTDFIPAHLFLDIPACFCIMVGSAHKYSRSHMTMHDVAEHLAIGVVSFGYFALCVGESYYSEVELIVRKFFLNKSK